MKACHSFLLLFPLLIYVFNVRKMLSNSHLEMSFPRVPYNCLSSVYKMFGQHGFSCLGRPIKLDKCVFTFNISYNHTFPSFWQFLKVANLLMVLLWHLYIYFVLHSSPTAFSHSKTCHVYVSESDILSLARNF